MLGVGFLVFKFIYYTIHRDRRTSGHLQPVEANSYTCSFLEPPVLQTKGYHTTSFAGSTPLLLPSSSPLLPYPYALLKPFSSAACASWREGFGTAPPRCSQPQAMQGQDTCPPCCPRSLDGGFSPQTARGCAGSAHCNADQPAQRASQATNKPFSCVFLAHLHAQVTQTANSSLQSTCATLFFY